jgi:hypothetical protein
MVAVERDGSSKLESGEPFEAQGKPGKHFEAQCKQAGIWFEIHAGEYH